VTYLDTHAVLWLYSGETDRFSSNAGEKIEQDELYISPIVLLEMQYLKEIGRVTAEPSLIIDYLGLTLGLQACSTFFGRVIAEAMLLDWTRDPFDRIIVATAAANAAVLVTKDTDILRHYAKAVW